MIMKSLIQPVKGTRDFFPREMALRSWLYGVVREVSESFGYQEYDGPFLEPVELYAAKSGEELVKEQSFVFPDRGGDLVTLRPELTPSLVRMVAQRQNQLVFPLRWWSFGPFWRYERPQKGRAREFFQWNIDIVGVGSPEADAEMAAIIATFFRKVGLSPRQVILLVNNRRLIDSELRKLDISPALRSDVFRLVDRRDKMGPEDWQAYAEDLGISRGQLAGLTNLLEDQAAWQKSEELTGFFAALDALGAGEYVRFDPGVVRGLDYYTGTVFEAQDMLGEVRRSILGGGRYDNLMADVGGAPLPGTGFAMGDMVITLILEKAGLIPKEIMVYPAPVLVTVFDHASLLDSCSLAAELRQSGLKVATYPMADKLAKQFKYADRIGARVVLVLGPEELARGSVTVRDLDARQQSELPRSEALKVIRQILERPLSS